MRTVGALPSLRNSRNPLVSVAVVALALLLAYQAAETILSGDLTNFGYAGVLVCMAVAIIAILNDWRRGVYMLMTWILFEDFARKFLGNNMAIYFVKDLLVLILYLSFFRSRAVRRVGVFSIPFRLSLLVFFWFAFLQVFNPASTSIFYGILGIKVYFLYVPLIYVGYTFVHSQEDLLRFFSFICVLIIIVAGLGIAQSIIGPSFLNPAQLQEDISQLSHTYRVAPISGLMAYRPTSVFVSAGRFQDFLVVAWLISLGFGGYLLLGSRQGRQVAFTAIGTVATASLMCASRGVFMWNTGIALIIAAGFLWGAPWRQRETTRVLRLIQRAAFSVGIGIVLVLTIFPEELGSRLAIYSETLMPSSAASELVHRTQTYPLQQLGFAFDHPRWPYGYGMGTCTLGGQYVVRIMHAEPMSVGVESGFGNLIIELGIVGLVLWIVLGFSITLSAWEVAKELKGTRWFPLAFATFLFAFILFFPMTYTSFSAYQDFVINSNLWLLIGILYRLRTFPKLIRIAQNQAISRQA